jgi:lysophospholipase L1-like esterase
MRAVIGLLALLLIACGGSKSAPTTPAPAVFMGDSITADLSSTLPAQDVDAGVAGNTSRMMLARFQTDAMDHQPQVIAILGGTNDIRLLSNPTTEDIATMGQIAATAGACVIIGTLPPISDSNWTDTTSIEPAAGDAMIAAFNTQLRALAATHGYKLADYHAALTMSDGVTQNSALFIDGLHPNDQGNAAIWAVADPLIRACGLNQ